MNNDSDANFWLWIYTKTCAKWTWEILLSPLSNISDVFRSGVGLPLTICHCLLIFLIFYYCQVSPLPTRPLTPSHLSARLTALHLCHILMGPLSVCHWTKEEKKAFLSINICAYSSHFLFIFCLCRHLHLTELFKYSRFIHFFTDQGRESDVGTWWMIASSRTWTA